MQRWLAGMAVWMCACSVHAQEPHAQVTLAVDAGVLHARYQLPAPMPRFALDDYDQPQRQETWTPGSADWSFDGLNVSRKDGATFSEFSLELHPDIRFLDRHYMAVERIGADGWLVFLDALRASTGATEVGFELPAGSVVRLDGRTFTAPFPVTPLQDDEQRVVYVGPQRHITPGAVTVIAGEEVPAWLRATLVQQLNTSVAALTTRLGGTLPAAPTVFVTYEAEWPGGGFKGGTLKSAVIALSVRGMRLDEGDSATVDELVATITHEVVHFWNGELWETTRNEEEPWLHEGAAEYLASRVSQNDASLLAEATTRLNSCVARQDRRPLNGSEGAVQGAVPYNCGFVMQLLAEAAALRNGQGDIFALWRAVFAAADASTYSPESFLLEATRRGGDPFAAAAILLLQEAAADVATLVPALAQAGLAVSPRSPDAREGNMIRGRALMPVLESLCEGGHGFFTNPDHLKLDTAQRCGGELANDPAVVSVNGVDLFTQPAEAHAAIRAACARNGELVFGTLDGYRLQPVNCNAVIEALPQVVDLEKLPAFPR